MKNVAKKVLSLILVMAMIVVSFQGVSYAAKKASTKAQGYDSHPEELKGIPTVKKGTTVVTVKPTKNKYGQGYVKFKVPKTAKYTFTVSNVISTSSSGSANGYFYIMQKNDYGYYSFYGAKTQGGETDTLRVANSKFLKNWTHSDDKKSDYLKSRYGTVKLKKGQVVYIYTSFAGVYSEGTLKYTLNIKSK